MGHEEEEANKQPTKPGKSEPRDDSRAREKKESREWRIWKNCRKAVSKIKKTEKYLECRRRKRRLGDRAALKRLREGGKNT